MGNKRAGAGLASSSSLAKWGLVTVSELLLLPGEDRAQMQTEKEKEEKTKIGISHRRVCWLKTIARNWRTEAKKWRCELMVAAVVAEACSTCSPISFSFSFWFWARLWIGFQGLDSFVNNSQLP